MAIRRDLRRLEHEQEIRFPGRHHRAEDLLAETDVAGDGAATLAHAFDFAFLDIIAGAQGGGGEYVGAFEHALAAQTGDHNIGNVIHGTNYWPTEAGGVQ